MGHTVCVSSKCILYINLSFYFGAHVNKYHLPIGRVEIERNSAITNTSNSKTNNKNNFIINKNHNSSACQPDHSSEHKNVWHEEYALLVSCIYDGP